MHHHTQLMTWGLFVVVFLFCFALFLRTKKKRQARSQITLSFKCVDTARSNRLQFSTLRGRRAYPTTPRRWVVCTHLLNTLTHLDSWLHRSHPRKSASRHSAKRGGCTGWHHCDRQTAQGYTGALWKQRQEFVEAAAARAEN